MRKGSGDRYGQNSSGKLVAEGVEARVPYRGPLADNRFPTARRPAQRHGLRRGLESRGTPQAGPLRQITSGGLRESHAHDITITEEP